MSLSDVVGGSGLQSWSEIGLIISFITFLAILVWLFVIRRGPVFERESLLPLEEIPVAATTEMNAEQPVSAELEEVDDT